MEHHWVEGKHAKWHIVHVCVCVGVSPMAQQIQCVPLFRRSFQLLHSSRLSSEKWLNTRLAHTTTIGPVPNSFPILSCFISLPFLVTLAIRSLARLYRQTFFDTTHCAFGRSTFCSSLNFQRHTHTHTHSFIHSGRVEWHANETCN